MRWQEEWDIGDWKNWVAHSPVTRITNHSYHEKTLPPLPTWLSLKPFANRIVALEVLPHELLIHECNLCFIGAKISACYEWNLHRLDPPWRNHQKPGRCAKGGATVDRNVVLAITVAVKQWPLCNSGSFDPRQRLQARGNLGPSRGRHVLRCDRIESKKSIDKKARRLMS